MVSQNERFFLDRPPILCCFCVDHIGLVIFVIYYRVPVCCRVSSFCKSVTECQSETRVSRDDSVPHPACLRVGGGNLNDTYYFSYVNRVLKLFTHIFFFFLFEEYLLVFVFIVLYTKFYVFSNKNTKKV